MSNKERWVNRLVAIIAASIGAMIAISTTYLCHSTTPHVFPISVSESWLVNHWQTIEECQKNILDILLTKDYVDYSYAESLSYILCNYVPQEDIEEILTILYMESRWKELPRDKETDCYLPSKSNDYGPMQINRIHKETFGNSKFKCSLKENIHRGTDIYYAVGKNFGRYNGSGKNGEYNKRANKILQKIKGISDENL